MSEETENQNSPKENQPANNPPANNPPANNPPANNPPPERYSNADGYVNREGFGQSPDTDRIQKAMPVFETPKEPKK